MLYAAVVAGPAKRLDGLNALRTRIGAGVECRGKRPARSPRVASSPSAGTPMYMSKSSLKVIGASYSSRWYAVMRGSAICLPCGVMISHQWYCHPKTSKLST